MPIKKSYEKALRNSVESAPFYQFMKITMDQIGKANRIHRREMAPKE